MDPLLRLTILLQLWCFVGLDAHEIQCNKNYCTRQHGSLRYFPANKTEESYRLQINGQLLEQEIHRQCAKADLMDTHNTTVYATDVPFDLPGNCSMLALCDKTSCLLLGEEAFLFSEDTYPLSNHTMRTTSTSYLSRHELGAALSHKTSAIPTWNISYLARIRNNAAYIRDVFSANKINRDAFMSDTNSILNTYYPTCDMTEHVDYQDIMVNVNHVPFGCDHIKICNDTRCILYPHLAVHLAWVVDYSKGGLGTRGITYCAAEQIQLPRRIRTKRRATIFPLNPARSFLSFNLPGYRFCGPGTIITIQDDVGGPINEIDSACRQHDLDYMLGVDPNIADSKLLQRVMELGSPLYPAFSTTFEAKRYFEKLTGHVYTSSLYFVPNNESASLSQYFYFNSVYENYNASSVELAIGRGKEERWRLIIEDIWRGYCYSGRQAPMGENQQNSEPLILDTHGSNNGQGNLLPGTIPPKDVHMQSIESTQDFTQIAIYNIPPAHFGGCRLLISEISSTNTLNRKNFVELQKVCPINNRNRALKLDGFRLLLLEAGDPPTLLVNAVLTDKFLDKVNEKIDGRSRNSYYFVLGSDELHEKDMNILSTQHVITNIPDGGRSTYAVVLVFTPKDTFGIPCLRENPTVFPYPLHEEDIVLIGNAIQDVVVYGAPCALDICGVFKRWTPGSRIMPEDNAFLPLDDQNESHIGKTYTSISRCTSSLLPVQFSDWQTTNPTPKQKNICTKSLVPYSYSLSHSILQSTAQKIAVNTYDFFSYALQNPTIFENTPLKLTSLASNIHIRQVSRILERHRAQTIATPGKKRKGSSFVLSRFDTMDLDLIREIIQEEYRNARPPFFMTIYNNAMRAFQNNLPNAGGIGRKGCGTKTFRKLLRKMGFRYGKIDMRSVVLQRPDVVAWRGRYLKALRDNARGKKLQITWTDETWLDTNLRTGKAWVPDPDMYPPSEQIKYTYARHKVSRGPRLIVLHAGNNQGFIHEVMKVYPVGGKQTLLDYHGNVDSKTYYTWFRSLLSAINNTGEHIIVIDNAPYHTFSEAPKQNNKKDDLLKWIRVKDPAGTVTGFQEGILYLKWELWEMIKKLKKTVPHYIIDQMAAAEGHTILRLPPYNCDLNPIELVWKDVKDYVKKNNRDQTIDSVREAAELRMLIYTPAEWEAHIGHVERLGEKYWIMDGFYDSMMEEQQIIVPLNEDEDEEDDEDDVNDVGDPIHSTVHDGEGLAIDNNGRILDEDDGNEQRAMDYSARRRLNFPTEEMQVNEN